MAKIDLDDIEIIKEWLYIGMSRVEMAKRLGVAPSTVLAFIRRHGLD